MTHAVWLLFFYSISMLGALSAPVTSVRREIRYNNGAIWVEDKLTVQKYFLDQEPALRSIVDASQNGKTNFTPQLRTMLDGEGLEIKEQEVNLSRESMEIRILSSVIFKGSQQAARLKWVPTWGGITLKLPNGTLGRSGTGIEILIFESDGKAYLLFPNLGPAQPVANLKALKESIDWLTNLGDGPSEFVCVMKASDRVERLLHWNFGEKKSNPPDTRLIDRMDKAGDLSLNDIMTLCTSLKVAKPGCYEIVDGGDLAGDRVKSGK